MSSWKGTTRGGILGYKIFIALLKYTGLPLAYFLLRFVTFYFFIFSGRSFQTTFSFYRERLGYGSWKSFVSVYRNYYVFGQVLLDRTALMAGYKTRFTFTFEGEEYLRQMVGNGTGGLLISAHIGNFEMAGHMLERLETRVNIIMVDAEQEKIKRYLSDITKKTFHIILVKDDLSHIYEITQALKNREIVCIHGDRFIQGSKKITCSFLGREAEFPAGPFYLAMKYHVPVSFVFAMKEKADHYHFYATVPGYYHKQTNYRKRDETVRDIVTGYIRELETMLEKYPLQWFNYYDFWKKVDN
ncbi:MAG: acyltransferase [Bacteroidales bacterium]|nr:acyltransferase [Bacteroidales bacterium]